MSTPLPAFYFICTAPNGRDQLCIRAVAESIDAAASLAEARGYTVLRDAQPHERATCSTTIEAQTRAAAPAPSDARLDAAVAVAGAATRGFGQALIAIGRLIFIAVFLVILPVLGIALALLADRERRQVSWLDITACFGVLSLFIQFLIIKWAVLSALRAHAMRPAP